jgi:putative ATP-dependent endonuclease of the OLD family
LTVLEIGGAYAHRFASFLEFLGIPYLVITDIDSVDPENKRTACRADTLGAVTSNASLTFFFGKKLVKDLVDLKPENQVLFNGVCLVSYQRPTDVPGFTTANSMHGRTFEEALIYEQLELFRDKKIDIKVDLPAGDNYGGVYQTIFEHVKSDSFKKTEFALDVASTTENWNSPKYIADALIWLEKRLTPTVEEIA